MTIVTQESITRNSDPDAIMYDLILNFKEMMLLKITLLALSKKGAVMGNCSVLFQISANQRSMRSGLRLSSIDWVMRLMCG